MPSVEPSKSPSVHPSAAPSLVPSVDPSAGPTVDPTAAPFIAPTAVPSVMPTVRPTVPAVKDYELAVNVEQDLYNVTKAAYDAQKAAINSTIQHTVADGVELDDRCAGWETGKCPDAKEGDEEARSQCSSS
eukprot:gene11005-12835_t